MLSGLKIFFNRIPLDSFGPIILSLPAIISVPIVLLTTPVLIQTLGLAILGQLILANSIFIISTLLLCGVDKNVTKILSMAPETHRRKDFYLKSLFFQILIALALLAYCQIQSTIQFFGLTLNSNFVTWLILGSVTQWLWSIQRSILLAEDKLKTVSSITLIFNGSFFLLPIGQSLISNQGLDTLDYLSAIIGIRFLLVSFVIGLNFIGLNPNTATNQILKFSELYGYGKWMGITQFCQTTLDNADRLIIGIFLGTANVASYSLAVSVTQKITVLPVALATLIFTKRSRKHDASLEKDLKLIIIFLLTGVIFFLTLRDWFFTKWIGENYTSTLKIIATVSFMAYTIYGMNAVMSSMIEAANKAKHLARFDFACLILTLIGYFIWVPEHGLISISIVFLINQLSTFGYRLLIAEISIGLKSSLAGACLVILLGGLQSN